MKWEKTITTAREYEESLASLSKIFEADRDSIEGIEAELLVTLIEKYEIEHDTKDTQRHHFLICEIPCGL